MAQEGLATQAPKVENQNKGGPENQNKAQKDSKSKLPIRAAKRMAVRIKGLFSRNKDNPQDVLNLVSEGNVLSETNRGNRAKRTAEKFVGRRKISADTDAWIKGHQDVQTAIDGRVKASEKKVGRKAYVAIAEEETAKSRQAAAEDLGDRMAGIIRGTTKVAEIGSDAANSSSPVIVAERPAGLTPTEVPDDYEGIQQEFKATADLAPKDPSVAERTDGATVQVSEPPGVIHEIPATADELTAQLAPTNDTARVEPSGNELVHEDQAQAAEGAGSAAAEATHTEVVEKPAAAEDDATGKTTEEDKTAKAEQDAKTKSKPEELLKSLGLDPKNKEVTELVEALGKEENAEVAEAFNGKLEFLNELQGMHDKAKAMGLDLGIERPDMSNLVDQIKNQYKKELDLEETKDGGTESKKHRMLKMIWEVVSEIAIELAKEAAAAAVEGAVDAMNSKN